MRRIVGQKWSDLTGARRRQGLGRSPGTRAADGQRLGWWMMMIWSNGSPAYSSGADYGLWGVIGLML